MEGVGETSRTEQHESQRGEKAITSLRSKITDLMISNSERESLMENVNLLEESLRKLAVLNNGGGGMKRKISPNLQLELNKEVDCRQNGERISLEDEELKESTYTSDAVIRKIESKNNNKCGDTYFPFPEFSPSKVCGRGTDSPISPTEILLSKHLRQMSFGTSDDEVRNPPNSPATT